MMITRAISSRAFGNFAWALLVATILIASIATSCEAAPGTRGQHMRVEFLFSIESVGGRGEHLRTLRDLFYDRQSQELYVADAGLGAVLVYSREGAFLQDIPVRGDEGVPMLVATDREGRIYVGHNRSNKISVFDFRGELLDRLELPGIVDLPGAIIKPLLLTRDSSGQVVTLKTRGGLIAIDPFGESSREIPLALEDGPGIVKGMTCDSQGRYYFTDMRPASVVRWDPETDETLRFGDPGIIYGQISRPQGVAVDDAGHVFVTSLIRNNVLCYDRDGNFVEEFGGIGKQYGRFYMPGRIASDGVDRLFVLEEALKRIQVFRVSFPEEDSAQEARGLPAEPRDELQWTMQTESN